ncbi:MAG: GntR family transcriptional regulator [Rhodospirillaceae bacterium]|nr:GntR family transcriptional regulator [Rhodospirillaceae bacterium]
MQRTMGIDGAGPDRAARPGGVRGDGTEASAGRKGTTSLAELAYDRIEELLVHLTIKPGAYLQISDLQEMVRLGRSPVLEATRRFAHDTLMRILPRRGLHVAPIDLARERRLLRLRRDMERFVVELAAERATTLHRSQMARLTQRLTAERTTGNVPEFNRLDRLLDRVVLLAAAEPFIAYSLRPLRTLVRRTGYVYLTRIGEIGDFAENVDVHIDLLKAIAAGQVKEAIAASDALIDFNDRTFEPLQHLVEPALLDASLDPIDDI